MTNLPKRYLAAAVLGIAALGLSACGGGSSGSGSSSSSGKPVSGGTLRFAANGDVDHLDPLSAYYTPTFQLEVGYTRQLVTWPASNDYKTAISIVPDVATQVPSTSNGGISNGGKTYTFHLRSGVMWNTTPPRQVTSQDFLRQFKRMCNPVLGVGNPTYYTSTIVGMTSYCNAYGKVSPKATPAQLASFQNSHNISGISTPNSSTIVFHLTQPASDFLDILAMPFASAAPQEWNKYLPDSSQFRAHVYSDGPYYISQYNPGKKIVLSRNPAWKQSSDPVRHQYVKQVVVTEGVADPGTALQEQQANSADLVWDLPPPTSQLPQLESGSSSNFHIYPGHIDNNYIAFNLQKGPATNLKVRQAVEYAINKVAVSKIYGGVKIAPPISTIIPQGSIGYQAFNLYPSSGNQGDISKCKSLLSQAGYSSSHPLSLTYAYRNGGNHVALYQSVAANLKSCGINVKGLPEQQGTFYSWIENPANGKSGKWDITEAGWVPDWYGNNGRSVVQPLLTSPCVDPTTNYGCYKSKTVQNDVNKALSSASASTAAGYWHQADMQAMKDAALAPIDNLNIALYRSSRVKNAIYSPLYQQYDITQLWLSPPNP